MASVTTNYGFTKPAQSEAYDIDVYNDNMDAIDNNLKSVSDRVIINDNGGISIGDSSSATYGAAIGKNSSTGYGGAVGRSTTAGSGFAGGYNAKTSNGAAVGYNARCVDSSSGSGIDAVQLGTGTNSVEQSLQVYSYTLMNADGTIPAGRLVNAPCNVTITDVGGIIIGDGACTGSGVSIGGGTAADGVSIGYQSAAGSGAAIGYGAGSLLGGAVGYKAKVQGGGAIGDSASAESGGAVGDGATSTGGGFAGGKGAKATDGGVAIGNYAVTESGGSIGSEAETTSGFAGGYYAKAPGMGACIGNSSSAYHGGAVGYAAEAQNGFAGGNQAKCGSVDCIQLGTGTNGEEGTLKVYSYTLMDADGTIPQERMQRVYSTTPVQIGTWIDGTPIWRQAFEMTFTEEGLEISDKAFSFFPSVTNQSATYIVNRKAFVRMFESACMVDDWEAECTGSVSYDFGIPSGMLSYLENGVSGAYGWVEFVTAESNIK